MALIPFPNVVPSSNTRTELSNTAIFRSPFSGAIKTQGRGGDTLGLSLSFQNRTADQIRRLDAFLAALSGQTNRSVMRDHSYKGPSGALSVSDLLVDPYFVDIASNWQAAASMDLRSSAIGLRYEQVSGSPADVRPSPDAITVVSGQAYAFIVDFFGGYLPSGTSQQQVKIGTTSGANNIGNVLTATAQTQGRLIASGVASGSTLFASFIPTVSDVGQYVDITRASFSRCLQVNGFNQVGTRLLVSGLDTNTDGQLLAGDQFEVDGHLKILSADVDGDSSGSGVMDFFPPITTAPTDNEPIILLKPTGTFVLTNPNTARRNKPGGFSDYTLEFLEDVTA